MSNLTFYRQLRMDGGIRTGIDIDGDLVCGGYEPGQSDDDPRLLWFVDLRCEGPIRAKSARSAKSWLLKHSKSITEGFERYADEMQAGIDFDDYPLSWGDFQHVPVEIKMSIVLTAIRRVDGRQMAKVLRDIGSKWPDLVGGLKPVQDARRG